MNKRLRCRLALLCLAVGGCGSALADPAQDAVNASSQLSATQAAAVLTSRLVGDPQPAGLSLELAKFLRDNGSAARGREAQTNMDVFVHQTVRSLLGTALQGADTPEARALGISFPVDPATGSLQKVWDTYGLATTVAWTTAAYAAPDLAPWIQVHNTRVAARYAGSKTTSVTTGKPFVPLVTTGVTVGQSYTTTATLDVDALVAIALDEQVVTDLIVTQVPISTSVAVTVTCTTVSLGRCTKISTASATSSNDKVLATHPVYTFAYPLLSGEFATRATAMDVLQVAYDALGSLYIQAACDPLMSSPFSLLPGMPAIGPGLADLGTQAPAVNFYGLSTVSGSLADRLASGVVNPLLGKAGFLGTIPVRDHDPSAQVGLSRSLADPAFGLTAGYRAAEVRTGQHSVMVIRWHNVGATTISQELNQVLSVVHAPPVPGVPSPPASLYYDVPAGEYSLTESRLDSQNAVFKADWQVAAAAPPLVLPPTPPDLAALIAEVRARLQHG